eukprot:6179951-Amphidinium_carterae.1
MITDEKFKSVLGDCLSLYVQDFADDNDHDGSGIPDYINKVCFSNALAPIYTAAVLCQIDSYTRPSGPNCIGFALGFVSQ